MSAPKLSREEAHDLFGAYALGSLTAEEETAVHQAVSGWPAGEAELAELMEAAALLPLVPDDTASPSLALEGRLIAAARRDRNRRQAAARPRRGMAWWRRRVPHTLAAGFAAVAITLGALWISEDNPVADGRWLPLESTDPTLGAEVPGWVYVTNYRGLPVSLLFWGAPLPPEGSSYQLFRLLGNGDVAIDQLIELDEEGTGVLRLGPREDEDLVGFAVALVPGDRPVRTPPPVESVVLRFPPQ